jgi:hypothetical protein
VLIESKSVTPAFDRLAGEDRLLIVLRFFQFGSMKVSYFRCMYAKDYAPQHGTADGGTRNITAPGRTACGA